MFTLMATFFGIFNGTFIEFWLFRELVKVGMGELIAGNLMMFNPNFIYLDA